MDTFPALRLIDKSSDTILLAGAGGGFDIFAGIPLMLLFESMGKQVVLGNLSFFTCRYDGRGANFSCGFGS